MRTETRPCIARFQKNDIYSGLGDDSSTALDPQGAHEVRESQKERCEADELVVAEGGMEESSKGGTLGSRERLGERYIATRVGERKT